MKALCEWLSHLGPGILIPAVVVMITGLLWGCQWLDRRFFDDEDDDDDTGA